MSKLLKPEALSGRTAVITGAASGFGREFAVACAALGMRLALTDVNLDGLEETAALSRAPGRDVLLQRCDVSRADDVDAFADATHTRFGEVCLLFNNAGVLAAGPLWKATTHDWTWVLGVNLMGVAHGIRAFVPRMLKSAQPAWVVNTASVAGLVCPPELGVYAASKHAVVAVSECLFHELKASGASVGVSVLCPGYVDTGIADALRPAHLLGANPENDAFIDRTREAMKAGKLKAADIARITLDAVHTGRFYVLPHRNAVVGVVNRLKAIADAAEPDNPLGSR